MKRLVFFTPQVIALFNQHQKLIKPATIQSNQLLVINFSLFQPHVLKRESFFLRDIKLLEQIHLIIKS